MVSVLDSQVRFVEQIKRQFGYSLDELMQEIHTGRRKIIIGRDFSSRTGKEKKEHNGGRVRVLANLA